MDFSKIPGRVWVTAIFLVLALFALFSGVLGKIGFTPNWGLFYLTLFLFIIGGIAYYIVFANKFGLDKAQSFMLILVLVLVGFVGYMLFKNVDIGGLFNSEQIQQSVMSVFK